VAKLTDRGFTEDEAQEFMDRASGPHTLLWTAEIYRWVHGEENTLLDEVPIVGGTLTLDGSDPTRRRLTLDVAGGDALIPDKPYDPLAPFGQVIKLYLKIDRADGSWFPRLKMGEYPIQTTTVEWPSLTQTVEAADYSWLVDAYLFEKKKSYNAMTIREAVEEIVKDALPDTEFFIQSPGDAHTIKVEPHTTSEVGTGRWEFATTICHARGFDTFFNHNGNLVIRHDVTNNSSEVDTIPGEGPDIGTVSNPAAVIQDGPGGNLVALTMGLTREGAVNGVFINVHETVSQRIRARKKREAESGTIEPDPQYVPDWDDILRGDAPPPPEPDDTPPDPDTVEHGDPEVPKIPNPAAGDPRVNVTVKALGVGPIKWGDKFGRQNIVLERNVKRINDNVVASQIHRAKRLLHKRGGVIRSMDLDAVGLYWLEPDDKVRVKYAGRTEAHYVASVEFDLSGAEPARVRTRSITTDLYAPPPEPPGGGG
jgi:hypothetical protein